MLAHFLDICRAETVKLFSRVTAKMGLVVAAVLGVFGPIALWAVLGTDVVWNGERVADNIEATAPIAMQYGLELRNFFVLKMFIIVLIALSVAGEYRGRTIREDLVRPVPRWMVPMGKWAAVSVFALTTLLVGWVFSGLLSVIVFGVDGEWMRPISGYAVSLLSDVGFAAVVLVVAVASRSVAGTVAGVFLLYVFDWMFGVALKLVSWLSGLLAGANVETPPLLQRAIELQPWLPSSAFDCWSGYAARTDWDWRNFVSLGVITLVSAVVAERLFNRVDVP